MYLYIKILTFLIANSFILYSNNISGQWITGSIDTITHDKTSDYLTSPKSISIDKENTIHIVWQKREIDSINNSWRIYYTFKTVNGAWSSPTPISDSLMNSVYPSIIVSDVTNQKYIVYSQVGKIFLAYLKNNIWANINLTENNLWGYDPDIDIDFNGNVHIAWIGGDSLTEDKIFYCNNVHGVWSIDILEDIKCNALSLSVEQFGKVHIVYSCFDGLLFITKHVHNNMNGGKIWKYENIPNVKGGNGIVRISESGVIHYVYNCTEGFQFPIKSFYTKKANSFSEWTSPEILKEDFDGVCTSFEVDKNDKLHVLRDSTSGAFGTGKVFYFNNYSGVWNISTVVNNGNIFFSNLILDKKGVGHVIGTNQIFFEYQNELVHFQSLNSLINIEYNNVNYVANYKLFQNFPNPFNNSTVIKYHIPKKEFIKINIYSIVGKKIKTIFEGISNDGEHELKFNGDDLASGVYFYSLELKSSKEIKTMILIK